MGANSHTANVAYKECPECRGEGFVKVRHFNRHESYYCYTETVQCPTCKGERHVPA